MAQKYSEEGYSTGINVGSKDGMEELLGLIVRTKHAYCMSAISMITTLVLVSNRFAPHKCFKSMIIPRVASASVQCSHVELKVSDRVEICDWHNGER